MKPANILQKNPSHIYISAEITISFLSLTSLLSELKIENEMNDLQFLLNDYNTSLQNAEEEIFKSKRKLLHLVS